jgi:Delta3-Delta2-enoyl-CoA isomerase
MPAVRKEEVPSMKFVEMSIDQNVAKVVLSRGTANAINEVLTEELKSCFDELAADADVKAVVLSGKGNFFSFGLDIPEFLQYAKEDFMRFVTKFADLYTYIFLYPKPVIAALNGHTIAGGCVLAIACDYRVMVSGKARISLKEINFGASLFPGSAEMLKYCVGCRNAELAAYTGAMYSAEKAKGLGLIDQVVPPKDLPESAAMAAQEFARRYSPAFESIKMLLRGNVGEEMKQMDKRYRNEMVDIWYSEQTWEQLQRIKIHE